MTESNPRDPSNVSSGETEFSLRVRLPGRAEVRANTLRDAMAPDADFDLAEVPLPARWNSDAAVVLEQLWDAAVAAGAVRLPSGLETELWGTDDHVAIVIVASDFRLLGRRIHFNDDSYRRRVLHFAESEPTEIADRLKYALALLEVLVAELNDQLDSLA